MINGSGGIVHHQIFGSREKGVTNKEGKKRRTPQQIFHKVSFILDRAILGNGTESSGFFFFPYWPEEVWKTTDSEYKSTFFLLHCDFDGDIVWSFFAVILSLLTSYKKMDGLHFAPAENFTLFFNGDRLKILKNGAHIQENRNQTGVVMGVLGPLLSSLKFAMMIGGY
ncbi:hypothetical protein CEXT_773211 [Caerostris extrusa]|uniref:Uncharacterized protein n=1 Tax=Caerostris extrusa TaxID=172846 RepID=A0AAV4PTM5_CAEEX|nr:hypothetical protein CEXT_773211 [Caerostris extrusa]